MIFAGDIKAGKAAWCRICLIGKVNFVQDIIDSYLIKEVCVSWTKNEM